MSLNNEIGRGARAKDGKLNEINNFGGNITTF